MTYGLVFKGEKNWRDFEQSVQALSDSDCERLMRTFCIDKSASRRYLALNIEEHYYARAAGFTDEDIFKCFDEYGYIAVKIEPQEEFDLLKILGKQTKHKNGLSTARIEVAQLPNGRWIAGHTYEAGPPTYQGCAAGCHITCEQFATKEAAVWAELDEEYLTAEEIRLLGAYFGIPNEVILERLLGLVVEGKQPVNHEQLAFAF